MAKSNQLANLFNGVLLEYDFRTEDAQSNAKSTSYWKYRWMVWLCHLFGD